MDPQDNDFTIGVSLSGGGHRATLFGLGALLAIVDSGLHEKVAWISSVSGGSLANSKVAVSCDFNQTNEGEFGRICQSVLASLDGSSSVTGGKKGRWRLASYLLTLSVLAASILWAA